MNELKTLLSNLFPAIDFDKESSLIKDGLLDSLDLFKLIGALEQEYKLTIPMEELTAENFSSLNTMHTLLCKLLK